MKKVLSFVLVLAMILGCTSMAFATYKDQADVTNTEAVAVLSAVGVFAGDQNGNMNPKATLTRAEACAVIARLMLGTKAADKLSATAAPFKDVPADNWAAGYVSYCASKKIVGGIGNNMFNPTGTLKVGEFGKMLLCVLGYDATAEGLVGDDWATNTDALMLTAGINVEEANSDDCAREVAAQLALNTLQADCVKYDGTGANISVGGTVIEFGKGNAKKVEVASGAGFNGVNDQVQQLAEKLYGNDLKVDTATDAFGNPATKWTYKTKEVCVADEAAAEFTKQVKAKDVLSALKGYKVLGTEIKTVDTATTTNDAVDGVNFVTNASIVASIAALTANGRLLKVYADANKNITEFVAVDYTVAKVSSVTEKKTCVEYKLDNVSGAGLTDTLYVYNDDADGVTNVEFAGEVAKNDYVTYVKGNDDVYYVYPTTKVTGTQTSNKSNATLVVDGTTYTVAAEAAVAGATKDKTTKYANSTVDRNFYLDQFGFVVMADAVKTTDVYAVLDKIVGKTTTGLNGSQSVEARLVFEDGSTKDVVVSELNGYDTTKSAQVSITNSVSLTSPVAISKSAVTVGQIVTYTVDKDGNYVLKSAAASVAGLAISGEAITTKGVPTIGTSDKAVANADTVYVVKTKDTKGNDVFNAYTGYANVPSIKKANTFFVAQYIKTLSKVTFVYIDATAGYTAAAKDANIFFTTNVTASENGTGASKYFEYAGILNGEKDSIKAKATLSIAKGTLYDLTIDEDGYVTEVTGTAFTEVDINAANVTDISNGNLEGKIWDDNTVVYLIDEDGNVAEGSVEDAYEGSKLYYVVVDADGTPVEQATFETVYIIDEAVLL